MPACYVMLRDRLLDDRRGNGAAVDMRAAALEWLTSSTRLDGCGVLSGARNEATARRNRRPGLSARAW